VGRLAFSLVLLAALIAVVIAEFGFTLRQGGETIGVMAIPANVPGRVRERLAHHVAPAIEALLAVPVNATACGRRSSRRKRSFAATSFGFIAADHRTIERERLKGNHRRGACHARRMRPTAARCVPSRDGRDGTRTRDLRRSRAPNRVAACPKCAANRRIGLTAVIREIALDPAVMFRRSSIDPDR
jgi:hypothetical protein